MLKIILFFIYYFIKIDRRNQKYNLLDEIDTEKDDWNIKVRVTRMWEVLNIKTNNELIIVDLVLLDEKVSFEVK